MEEYNERCKTCKKCTFYLINGYTNIVFCTLVHADVRWRDTRECENYEPKQEQLTLF